MKRKPPTWVLDDQYGVGRNAYNWILYTRDGEKVTEWTPKYFYPTAQQLLAGLHEELALKIPAHYPLTHHLEVAADRAHSLTSEFLERINSNPQLKELTAMPEVRS